MEYVLAGFRQFENVRRYYFDTAGDGLPRQRITVGADLNLIRRFKIPLQELPLFCLHLLENRTKIEATVITEGDLVQYSNERDEAAAVLKKRRERNRAASRFGRGKAAPASGSR